MTTKAVNRPTVQPSTETNAMVCRAQLQQHVQKHNCSNMSRTPSPQHPELSQRPELSHAGYWDSQCGTCQHQPEGATNVTLCTCCNQPILLVRHNNFKREREAPSESAVSSSKREPASAASTADEPCSGTTLSEAKAVTRVADQQIIRLAMDLPSRMASLMP